MDPLSMLRSDVSITPAPTAGSPVSDELKVILDNVLDTLIAAVSMKPLLRAILTAAKKVIDELYPKVFPS